MKQPCASTMSQKHTATSNQQPQHTHRFVTAQPQKTVALTFLLDKAKVAWLEKLAVDDTLDPAEGGLRGGEAPRWICAWPFP